MQNTVNHIIEIILKKVGLIPILLERYLMVSARRGLPVRVRSVNTLMVYFNTKNMHN